MVNWTLTVLLLLCCVFWCWAGLAVGCDGQGPNNCTFETDVDLLLRKSNFTSCSWSGNHNWQYFSSIDDPWVHFTGLSKTKVTGRMTSRVSCSTQGQEFCFYFRYTFTEADEIDLKVNIQNSVTQSDDKVWSASRGFDGGFQQAYIPISTQYDYAVVFEATRRSTPSPNNTKSVYVDDLQFFQSPCPRCFTEGPENCTFQIDYSVNESLFTPCSWTSSGGWSGFQDTHKKYPGLDWDETYGQLTSRPACSTNGHAHYLMFDYTFSQNFTVNLIVSIRNIETGDTTMIWSKEQGPIYDSWERAVVSVRTSYNFVVIFEATRLSISILNKYVTAYIDNVAYVCNPCTSPTLATRPTTTTFPPTSTSTTRPTTSTSASRPTTLNIFPQTTFFATPESTTNIPLIAGLVAAAAVIIAVSIIVTVIFYRRCRSQRSSTPGTRASYVFSNAAAVNDENYPTEGADYDNIAEDPYSRPNAPSTRLDAKPGTDHGRSFNVDQGAAGSAAMTAADDGNNPVLFPSELYSGLTPAVHEQHHYSKFQARDKQSEKHAYVNP